jgi:hypothetical protein
MESRRWIGDVEDRNLEMVKALKKVYGFQLLAGLKHGVVKAGLTKAKLGRLQKMGFTDGILIDWKGQDILPLVEVLKLSRRVFGEEYWLGVRLSITEHVPGVSEVYEACNGYLDCVVLQDVWISGVTTRQVKEVMYAGYLPFKIVISRNLTQDQDRLFKACDRSLLEKFRFGGMCLEGGVYEFEGYR